MKFLYSPWSCKKWNQWVFSLRVFIQVTIYRRSKQLWKRIYTFLKQLHITCFLENMWEMAITLFITWVVQLLTLVLWILNSIVIRMSIALRCLLICHQIEAQLHLYSLKTKTITFRFSCLGKSFITELLNWRSLRTTIFYVYYYKKIEIRISRPSNLR